MDTHTEAAIETGAIIDNTDELLSDLDMSPADLVEDLEMLETSTEEEDAIEVAAERADAYSEQVVTTADIETTEAVVTVEAIAEAIVKPKAARKVKEAGAPKVPKDLESIDAKVFVLSTDTPSDLEANKKAVIDTRPAQKKIGEKFDNLFQSIAAGRKPSTYVMQVYGILDEKGTATSTEIVAALKATASRKGDAYSQGTAMSQVGQIMVLFHLVGIATRTGQTLTIQRDAPISKKLKTLAAS